VSSNQALGPQKRGEGVNPPQKNTHQLPDTGSMVVPWRSPSYKLSGLISPQKNLSRAACGHLGPAAIPQRAPERWRTAIGCKDFLDFDGRFLASPGLSGSIAWPLDLNQQPPPPHGSQGCVWSGGPRGHPRRWARRPVPSGPTHTPSPSTLGPRPPSTQGGGWLYETPACPRARPAAEGTAPLSGPGRTTALRRRRGIMEGGIMGPKVAPLKSEAHSSLSSLSPTFNL